MAFELDRSHFICQNVTASGAGAYTDDGDADEQSRQILKTFTLRIFWILPPIYQGGWAKVTRNHFLIILEKDSRTQISCKYFFILCIRYLWTLHRSQEVKVVNFSDIFQGSVNLESEAP